MPQFFESYPRGGSTTFDDALGNRHYELKTQLALPGSPVRGSRLLFQQKNYDRTPVITADWFNNYLPFQILGLALSLSDYPYDNTKPKPTSYIIDSIKTTAESSNDYTGDFVYAYNEPVSLPYGYSYDQYQCKKVFLFHATETKQMAFAELWFEAMGAVKDTLLSSMLMPSPNHSVKFYRHPRYENRVFIVTNRVSVMSMHKIVGMLPILFNVRLAELPLPILPALFNSFTGMDADAFVTAAYSWIDSVQEKLKELLPFMERVQLTQDIKEFGARLLAYAQTTSQARVETTADTIKKLEEQLKAEYVMLQNLMLVAQLKTDDEILSLLDYLPKVQDLQTAYHATDYKINFTIKTHLQHYSHAEAERIMSSYRASGREHKARILEYVFVKEEFRILIQQAFFINFQKNTATKYGLANIPDSYADHNRAKNPHITYFGNGCWGDNARLIDRAMTNESYITAFNTALSAIRTVNLADGTAMQELYTRLVNNDFGNCFERVSDGARFNIIGFLACTAPVVEEDTNNETHQD